MILPLLVMMALAAPGDDCPKKAQPPIPPLPFTHIQTYLNAVQIDDDEIQDALKEAAKDAEKAQSRASRETRARMRVEADKLRLSHPELFLKSQKGIEKLDTMRQWVSDQNFGPGFVQTFKLDFGGPEPKLNLDIENLPIREALQKVFKATKLDFKIDEEVCKDIHITVKASNIRLSTALDMLTEAGGVHWSRDMVIGADEPGPKALYHIRKTPAGGSVAIFTPDGTGRAQILGGFGKGSIFDPDSGFSEQLLSNVLIPETRHKITCPHCKGKVVAYRPKVSDRCEKCHKKLPEGAKVCPADKTPRPAPPKPWKFCPLCGKPVDFED